MLLTKTLAPILPVLAAVGLGFADAPAQAHADTIDVTRTTVSMRGLDLATAADRTVLDRRIRRAVQTMCVTESLPRTGSQFVCINRAMREAREQRDAAVAGAIAKAAGERGAAWSAATRYAPVDGSGQLVPVDYEDR